MKMVRHDAEPKEPHGEARLGGCEQVEERLIVAVLVKDGCLAIATIEDMVGMAGK